MTLPNYLALIGWILISIQLFMSKEPQRATLIIVLGSFLFLPMSIIEIPFFPNLNKGTAIGFGIFFGEIFSGAKTKHPMKMSSYDLPMLLWCFLVPLASSLSNGLGLYDGIVGLMERVFSWGMVFWAGRRYFGSPSSMRALTMAMMLGGLLYVPLILIEIRVSPILHYRLYGYLPHSFLQHIRYGGYRPIVFMSHGLMVALWMAVTTTITFWLWKVKGVASIAGLPTGLAFVILAVSTILCKSANGVVFMLFGITTCLIYLRNRSSRLLRWLLLSIPFYIAFRLYGIINMEQIELFMARIFDAERVSSLMIRLLQEDLFGAKALLRPWFGWGWMGRAWPVNPETGTQLVSMVDSFWIIAFSTSGFLGLASVYLSLGLGPFRILKASGKPRATASGGTSNFAADAVVLSIILAFFMIDSLINGMVAPIYILCAGALASYQEQGGKESELEILLQDKQPSVL